MIFGSLGGQPQFVAQGGVGLVMDAGDDRAAQVERDAVGFLVVQRCENAVLVNSWVPPSKNGWSIRDEEDVIGGWPFTNASRMHEYGGSHLCIRGLFRGWHVPANFHGHDALANSRR